MMIERVERAGGGARVVLKCDVDLLRTARLGRLIPGARVLAASDGPEGMKVFELHVPSRRAGLEVDRIARTVDLLTLCLALIDEGREDWAIDVCAEAMDRGGGPVLRELAHQWRVECRGDRAQLDGRMGRWRHGSRESRAAWHQSLRDRVDRRERLLALCEQLMIGRGRP